MADGATTRPLIGVIMDYEASGSFSSRPHYALRCGYFDAVLKAGGLPVALPYLDEARDDYLNRCDGLIVPGGFYPFPSRLYGRDESPDETVHPRHRFEVDLTRAAMDRDMPFFGICAGMQVIAATKGCTLYADIGDDPGTNIDHLNGRPAEEIAHTVAITPGTLLHRIVGVGEMAVNTAHKEALRDATDGIVINARAPDGIVEGIELPDQTFCLGVQWHPEFFLDDASPHLALFRAFVTAAAERRDG